MKFTYNIIRFGCCLLVGLALTTCAGQETAETPPNSQLLPSPTPSFFASTATSYEGVILRGISEDTPSSHYVRDILIPAFTQETGLQVTLEIGELPQIEQIIQQGSSQYDFVYVEQDVIFGYLAESLLVNLSQTLQQNPHLLSPDFNPIDFTEFINEFKDPVTGDLYGVPMEAFIRVYVYRKDLFENPAIQEAFFAEYGYPLAPAVTFTQYRDIATFFSAYGQENNLALWGTGLQAAVGHIASFYAFFESIAPAFGVYNWGINTTSYKATIANGGQLNSAQAKKALKFWVDMLHYAPPESTNNTWSDVSKEFASGRVAQAWVYGEYVSELADPSRSQVADVVGVALPPTDPDVIEDTITSKGYIGYYDGAAFGIPINSQHKEAALLWLQYLGQPSIQPEWAVATGRVVHLSTFDDPLVKAQDERLDGYYTLMKEQGYLFSGAPPFPFHAAVRDVIVPFIHQAITGNLTPEEALDQAALAVDAELIRLGYGQ